MSLLSIPLIFQTLSFNIKLPKVASTYKCNYEWLFYYNDDDDDEYIFFFRSVMIGDTTQW